MAAEGEAASGFTVKEILLEMRGDLKNLADKIDRIDRQGSIGTKAELEDHESRLRINEAAIADLVAANVTAQRISGRTISWSAVGIAVASGIAQGIQAFH